MHIHWWNLWRKSYLRASIFEKYMKCTVNVSHKQTDRTVFTTGLAAIFYISRFAKWYSATKWIDTYHIITHGKFWIILNVFPKFLTYKFNISLNQLHYKLYITHLSEFNIPYICTNNVNMIKNGANTTHKCEWVWIRKRFFTPSNWSLFNNCVESVFCPLASIWSWYHALPTTKRS